MQSDPRIWLSYVSYPATTAAYIERALRKKHNVITIGPKLPGELVKQWQLENLKAPIKDQDIPTNFGSLDFDQIFKTATNVALPDLFLWIESVPGFLPINIKGHGFPTSCYLIDSHLNLKNHLEWAKNFDYTFITQREYLPEFKKAGIDKIFWLPLAADIEIHSKKSVNKIYDVGFVGSINSMHKRRAELLNKINSVAQVSYKRCFLDEMSEYFSASKIVFNNAIRNDLNMRLFEVMSIGSFLLTNITRNSGQEEMFKDGEDLGLYTDDNITAEVKYYLAHESERERIASHGRQIIHNAHTYSHRVEEILEVSFGRKAETPTAEEWRSRSLQKVSIPVAADLKSKVNHSNKRGFVIPVLDMSPASPYNIIRLLDELKEIEGDVIVIFNSLEMAEKLKDHPRIDYYAAMKKNVGVSRAWNIGLNIAQTPVTFIMNADLHISKETIENIERYLLNLPEAAIVGPQGSFYNFEAAKDILYFNKGTFKNPIAVDAVSGFLFAVKTELFNSGVIKFDNQYTPCYFEEWDLGLQIKQQNLKSYIVPVNGYEHEWSGSIRALRTIKYLKREETAGEILDRNRKLFWDKWKGIALLEGDNSKLLESNLKDILSEQADELISKNQTDDAEKVLRDLLKQYPNDKASLEKLGLLLYKSKKLDKALEAFEELQKLEPGYQVHTGDGREKKENNPEKQSGLMKIKKDEYYNNTRPDVQQLINSSSRVLLDVGCGTGNLAFELKNKLNAEAWGIEYNDEAAAAAEEKLDKVIPGKIEDTLNELPDNYFDTIIFADVLEHLIDPYSVLEKIKGKLSPGGEVVASIPNVRHWSVVKQLLEGRWDYQEWGIMDSTHLRFFTRQSIQSMFNKAGYKIAGLYCVVGKMEGLTSNLISTMKEANINVDTLEEESAHFQYLVKAVKK